MTSIQIAQKLADRFGSAILASFPADKHPRIHVAGDSWRAVAEYLYHDPELAFDWLADLAAVDYPASNQLAIVCDFRSTRHEHWFAVKVMIDRADAKLPTVSDLWPTANWHEREAYDLMGITFTQHPDHRRILLPEDWVGHPLRKDYVAPSEYHGIPASYEMQWQQKPDYPK